MRVSLRWLEDYVAVDVPVTRLVEMLDLSGTKVEAVHRPGREISGVVVSEVLEIVDHPKADNLTLVEVKIEGERTERVVCGARNFAVGDRVPLATVGARLPGGFDIGERKIRGEVSRGMLCSGKELGVSKDHSGILVLPADAPLGEDVVDVLGLDDTVLELELTPNRPDCMSMVGVAREVAALLGNELKIPPDDLDARDDVDSPVGVELKDPKGCPRYLARYIEGVSAGPSPAWMSRRLMAAGVRPISNIVDATNYVMLEVGQPLHAFDASLIADRVIVVRRAHRGERFTTLDGVERTMHEDDLMIADPKRAVGIAGVMGGERSEVSDRTSDVILESAYFDKDSIAFTSRRHLLRTEASARFERGTDPEAVAYAAARAARLMAEHAGGRVAGKTVDAYPTEIRRRTITLRPARSDRVLGITVDAGKQASYLRSIGLSVKEGTEALDVEIPSFRPDLEREIDLVEEVARLAGFERLLSTIPPGRTGGLDRDQAAERAIRRHLASYGLNEAWTPSFGSPRDHDDQGLAEDHPARRMVRLSNPVSEDLPALRTSTLPNLMRAAARSIAHGASGVPLFEIARVYEPTPDDLPREALVLGAVLAGERRPKTWSSEPLPWDLFAAKGILEALLGSLGTPAPGFAAASGMPFHPTRAATVTLAGAALGALGEIHPDVCGRFDVPEQTTAFEIALAPVFAALPGRIAFEPLPRFPSIHIDLAVVVDRGVVSEPVRRTILEAGAPEVADARLFDVYVGEQVPDGKKSLAFALELRDPERTLTDDDAVGARDRVMEALSSRFGATLRA